MKAVLLEEFGGPEKLVCTEVVTPKPASNEVLVRVNCCGVCHLDLILRSGMRSRVNLPRILGHELAGEVVEVGSGVADFVCGDRVASYNFQSCGECEFCLKGRPSLCRKSLGDIGQTRDGGYAQYANLNGSSLVKIPAGMPYEHACFAACVYGPPYKAIRLLGRTEPGQSVLVTGASGGLGLASIQIAKSIGARVFAVTTSPRKAERLHKAGADEVVIDKDGSFGDEVRARTDGKGVHLAVELTGSPTFKGTLRSLAPGGKCAVIGELHGNPVQINLGLLILKEWEIFGVQSANRSELTEVLDFMADRGIEPVIADKLPLERAGDAHQKVADRAVVGRILLEPNP